MIANLLYAQCALFWAWKLQDLLRKLFICAESVCKPALTHLVHLFHKLIHYVCALSSVRWRLHSAHDALWLSWMLFHALDLLMQPDDVAVFFPKVFVILLSYGQSHWPLKTKAVANFLRDTWHCHMEHFIAHRELECIMTGNTVRGMTKEGRHIWGTLRINDHHSS